MPTRMKNVMGTEIKAKVFPLAVSAKNELKLAPPVPIRELLASLNALAIKPIIVPKRAHMRSCIHTIAQSALPISSANVCTDGFVSTLIY